MFSNFEPYFVSAEFLRAHLLDHALGHISFLQGFVSQHLGGKQLKMKIFFFDTTVVKCLLQEGQLLAARWALGL